MVDAAAFIGEVLSPVKQAWKHAYSSGDVHTVSQKVFQEEIFERFKGKSSLMPDDGWTEHVFAECLLSTEDCVLQSVLYGNLARDRVGNSKLLSALQKLKTQSELQPGIYMQQLVDL